MKTKCTPKEWKQMSEGAADIIENDDGSITFIFDDTGCEYGTSRTTVSAECVKQHLKPQLRLVK